MRTHNSLRKANGLDEVIWNNFLYSLAGIKSATLVKDDYRLSIDVPPLNAEKLKKGKHSKVISMMENALTKLLHRRSYYLQS